MIRPVDGGAIGSLSLSPTGRALEVAVIGRWVASGRGNGRESDERVQAG
jgi:hypothetical protein